MKDIFDDMKLDVFSMIYNIILDKKIYIIMLYYILVYIN